MSRGAKKRKKKPPPSVKDVGWKAGPPSSFQAAKATGSRISTRKGTRELKAHDLSER